MSQQMIQLAPDYQGRRALGAVLAALVFAAIVLLLLLYGIGRPLLAEVDRVPAPAPAPEPVPPGPD